MSTDKLIKVLTVIGVIITGIGEILKQYNQIEAGKTKK